MIFNFRSFMTRLSHILWSRLTHWLIRPKRLAIFEACLIGLVSGLAALLLGECVSWLGGWRRMMAHWIPVYYALPAIGLVGGFLAGWLNVLLLPPVVAACRRLKPFWHRFPCP